MKQYVVINNKLKMSKGKVARVCVTAGFFTEQLWLDLPPNIRDLWNDSQIIIILKTDNIEKVIDWAREKKINCGTHIDKGLTQVPENSLCMITFFSEDNQFLQNLKLY